MGAQQRDKMKLLKTKKQKRFLSVTIAGFFLLSITPITSNASDITSGIGVGVGSGDSTYKGIGWGHAGDLSGGTPIETSKRSPSEATSADAIGSTILSMMGGIPIGKRVSYGFQFSGIRSFPVCAASNGNPEVGDNVKAVCYNVTMPGVKTRPTVGYTSFDTEEGGAKSGSMTFNTEMVLKGTGKNTKNVSGTLVTQINADVYQGSTGLSGSSGFINDNNLNKWGWSDGTSSGSKNLNGWKTQDVSADDACKKYGVACGTKSKEEVNAELCSKFNVNCSSDGKNAFSSDAIARANKTGDICGSLGNAFCGSQSAPKENQVDWTKGKGLGSQVNDLLNDVKSESFNGSDFDWMSSSGGENGTGNLDDFFGGDKNTIPSANYPNGLTTDSFGLDGGEVDENGNPPLFNSSSIDNYGRAGYTPIDFSSPDESNSGYSKNGFSDILKDSLHNDLDGSNKANSLAGMIHNLISGENETANNDKSTLSNQDLFDLSKRLLMESGFSEEDIQNGENYDTDSSYSDPLTSWDFNRTTTLLKGRKVKFNNQYEVQQKPKTKQGQGGFGM